MNYTRRMTIAALLSALLHVAGLVMLYRNYDSRPPAHAVSPEPIVLDLQPDPAHQPPPPRQLIEPAVPAAEPPPPADLIAETNAEAMDTVATLEHDTGPQLEQDDFDELPQSASPPVPPAPAAPPPPKPARKEAANEAESKLLANESDIPLESVQDAGNERQNPPVDPGEPILLAQVQPALPERPAPGKSRSRTGVAKEGVTNFDAIQSDIAPYLKLVRQRVERRWNEMLYTRYSGTTPVKAVIDCAINPQGELVSVTVAGTENDRLYSALCRDAVLRAGPFGPFTFEVPDIYREKNLEIRWTFNFL